MKWQIQQEGRTGRGRCSEEGGAVFQSQIAGQQDELETHRQRRCTAQEQLRRMVLLLLSCCCFTARCWRFLASTSSPGGLAQRQVTQRE